MSNRFIHGIHGVLRSALDQAMKERLITDNPAEGCRCVAPLPAAIGTLSQAALAVCSFLSRSYSPPYFMHIVPGIGSIRLYKLTTLQIQQFYNKLKTWNAFAGCPRRLLFS